MRGANTQDTQHSAKRGADGEGQTRWCQARGTKRRKVNSWWQIQRQIGLRERVCRRACARVHTGKPRREFLSVYVLQRHSNLNIKAKDSLLLLCVRAKRPQPQRQADAGIASIRPAAATRPRPTKAAPAGAQARGVGEGAANKLRPFKGDATNRNSVGKNHPSCAKYLSWTGT